MLISYLFSINSLAGQESSDQKIPPRQVKLVQGFCYALQASMLCNNLKMRIDTEGKIENQFGIKIRGLDSPYYQFCLKGVSLAFEDEKHGLCSKAWEKYGCYGNDIPRLIQENPFRKENGVFCEY